MKVISGFEPFMSMQVTFHPSTFPDKIRRKVAKGISKRCLPASLLYESIGQANRWMNYAKAWSPIHRRDEITGLCQTVYESVLEGRGGDEIQYLALGCGDGLKDAAFLELADGHHQRAKVTLVDVSPSLTLGAAQRLSAWQPQMCVADLESQPTLSEICETEKGQLLVISCLGMLPTLGHEILLPYLASVLRKEDRLMLSANLSPSANDEDKAIILTQYDNPEAHTWYSGVLLELGFELSDFSLECCIESLQGIAGAYRIVVHAKMLKTLDFHVQGDSFPVAAGERFELFRSERWTPSALRHRLNSQGLEIVSGSESKDDQEGVYEIAKRSQSAE